MRYVYFRDPEGNLFEIYQDDVEYFGGIDILVINAGANYDRETVENSNLENWKRTLDVMEL